MDISSTISPTERRESRPVSSLRHELTSDILLGKNPLKHCPIAQAPSSLLSIACSSSNTVTGRPSSRNFPRSLPDKVPSDLYTRFPRFANTTRNTLPDLFVEDVTSTRLSDDEECIVQGGQDEGDGQGLARGSRRLRDAWRKTITRQNKRFKRAAEKLKKGSGSLCSEETLDTLGEGDESRCGLDQPAVRAPLSAIIPFHGADELCARVSLGSGDYKRRMATRLSPLQERCPVTDRGLPPEHSPAPQSEKTESSFVPLPEIQISRGLSHVPLLDLGPASAAFHEARVSRTSVPSSDRQIARSVSMTNIYDLPRSTSYAKPHSGAWSSSNASLRKASLFSLNQVPLARPVSRPDSVYDNNSLRSLSRVRQGPVFVGFHDDQAVNFVFPADIENVADDTSIRAGYGWTPASVYSSRQELDAPLLIGSSALKQAYERDDSHHKVARYVPSMILKPTFDLTSSYLHTLWLPPSENADVANDSNRIPSETGSMVCQASRSLQDELSLDDEDQPECRELVWVKACKILIDPLPGCRGLSSKLRWMMAGPTDRRKLKGSRSTSEQESSQVSIGSGS